MMRASSMLPTGKALLVWFVERSFVSLAGEQATPRSKVASIKAPRRLIVIRFIFFPFGFVFFLYPLPRIEVEYDQISCHATSTFN